MTNGLPNSYTNSYNYNMIIGATYRDVCLKRQSHTVNELKDELNKVYGELKKGRVIDDNFKGFITKVGEKILVMNKPAACTKEYLNLCKVYTRVCLYARLANCNVDIFRSVRDIVEYEKKYGIEK